MHETTLSPVAIDLSRNFRLFLSSTFQDLQPEREHLIKQVLPELRAIARERGVELTEIDLRWGVTEKEAAQGRVVRVCLDEIDRCQPFFLGILGDRYGWIQSPGDLIRDPELLARHPWIADDVAAGRSLVEIEIQYGVLRRQNMDGYAFFYLREPLAPLSSATPEPSHPGRERLEMLKNEIRQRRLPVRQFSSPEELGRLVHNDLLALLDRFYPVAAAPSRLAEQRRAHHVFADARRKAYVADPASLDALDAHVASGTAPLVLVGEAGCGKSSLLAAWSHRYCQQHPQAFVITHFFGAEATESDHISFLRRVLAEIHERYQISDSLPEHPSAIESQFPEWLAKVSARPVVLVVDGLNQLEGPGQHLGWLPTSFPDNVRLILSATPGPALEALRRRNWPTQSVEPLDENRRDQIIATYLKDYGKALDSDQRRRIAAHPSCRNALFLRTLIEDLRVFGRFEQLADQITTYLESSGPSELFRRILFRLEVDYGTHLLRELMSLIWASRKGLSEAEFLAISQSSRLKLSSLLYALDTHLLRRDGRLTFSHAYLGDAVRQRYLPDAPAKMKVHRRLSDFFAAQSASPRRTDELPWQLQKANEGERLKACLTDPEIFAELSAGERAYELIGYWLALGPQHDLVPAYQKMLADSATKGTDAAAQSKLMTQVGQFFVAAGRSAAAKPLFVEAIDLAKPAKDDPAGTLDAKFGLHGVLKNERDFEGAHKIDSTLFADDGTDREVADSYDEDIGYIMAQAQPRTPEELDSAITLYRVLMAAVDGLPELGTLWALQIDDPSRAEAMVDFLDSLKDGGSQSPPAIAIRQNLARLLAKAKKYDEAERLLREGLALSERKHGTEHPEVANWLNRLSGVLVDKGDSAAAEPLYRRSLAIRMQKLGRNHVETATTLNDLAILLAGRGEYKEAESLCQKAVNAAEMALGEDHPNTQSARRNLQEIRSGMRTSKRGWANVRDRSLPEIPSGMQTRTGLMRSRGPIVPEERLPWQDDLFGMDPQSKVDKPSERPSWPGESRSGRPFLFNPPQHSGPDRDLLITLAVRALLILGGAIFLYWLLAGK